ncbi:myelin-associated glycoprotein, partial [Brachyistius frenatus]|uniref:myelin-associated glycoprotein n=1 Tax=Brachyistius frenatus TaxID=100188 RepID=UPI0037E9248A
MDALKWPLFFMCLCSKVIQSEASSWTIQVPSSVKGLPGSCVVIPCSFNYPDPQKEVTKFTGIWTDDKTHHLIYHPVESQMMQEYRNRAKLIGDVKQKNCSLKIDPLQQSDQGPFYFRVEMAGYDMFSYRDGKVSISMIGKLNPITFSVKEEVKEGQTVSASCSVSHSCPTSPPVFNWSHSGQEHFQSQQLDHGQWKATSTLTFRPTHADHNKPLQCIVRYKGGQRQEIFKVLKVKYAPVNVKVEYNSDLKEGETVRLKCSSDAHPPASSYEWQNETGAQLYTGSIYMVPNVSRHTRETFYCTAINEEGRVKSSPVQLNVLCAPEIKTISSCSLEECVCVVESRPPSLIHFVLADRVLQSTKVDKRGSLTIGTLQTDFGSFKSVQCVANNTEGKGTLVLFFPVNSKMKNIFIAIGTGLGLAVILIGVGVVR